MHIRTSRSCDDEQNGIWRSTEKVVAQFNLNLGYGGGEWGKVPVNASKGSNVTLKWTNQKQRILVDSTLAVRDGAEVLSTPRAGNGGSKDDLTKSMMGGGQADTSKIAMMKIDGEVVWIRTLFWWQRYKCSKSFS